MRENDTDLLDAIREGATLPRTHASFFNWKNKGVKESGLVDEFLDPHNHCGQHDFRAFDVPAQDPPDTVLIDANGKKTALEVAELVNEDAIRAQIEHAKANILATARAYSRECEKWAAPIYLAECLNALIEIKNQKCDKLFDSGTEVQLLLHSDEMYLEACYKSHLSLGMRVRTRRFSRVWLLLSYSPQTQSCPLIEIQGVA